MTNKRKQKAKETEIDKRKKEKQNNIPDRYAFQCSTLRETLSTQISIYYLQFKILIQLLKNFI